MASFVLPRLLRPPLYLRHPIASGLIRQLPEVLGRFTTIPRSSLTPASGFLADGKAWGWLEWLGIKEIKKKELILFLTIPEYWSEPQTAGP
ncbi:hypothetical protein KY386_02925, partial [Candidatus Parcubacteria bacterium]|nr:hypothetical protein [Candidatus Parcubacteria bacterium]